MKPIEIVEGFSGYDIPEYESRHKLTREQVIYARKSIRDRTSSLVMLSVEFGVCTHTMSQAIRGSTFKHLTGSVKVSNSGLFISKDVLCDIRKRYHSGDTHRELSRIFGYCQFTIGQIIRQEGKYAYLKNETPEVGSKTVPEKGNTVSH